MQDPIVYIVDDDPDMRDSLRWLMKTVGLHAARLSLLQMTFSGLFPRPSRMRDPRCADARDQRTRSVRGTHRAR